MNSIKIVTLRRYELLCYRVAFYLLQEEVIAVEAACNALIQLSKDHAFFKLTVRKQNKQALNISIKAAIASKQQQVELHDLQR